MKFRKTLGVLLTMLGCIAAFLGLAASVLPLLANAQLQLVLDSFATPSQSFLVNGINHLMTFVLNRPLPVLLGGVLAAAGGIALLACAGSKPRRNPDEAFSRPAPRFSEEIESRRAFGGPDRRKTFCRTIPSPPLPWRTVWPPRARRLAGRFLPGNTGGTGPTPSPRQRKAHAAAFASVKPDERSPYQRPKTQEPRSPYQRPEEPVRPAEPQPEPSENKPLPPSPLPSEAEAAPVSSLSSIFEEDLLFIRSRSSRPLLPSPPFRPSQLLFPRSPRL